MGTKWWLYFKAHYFKVAIFSVSFLFLIISYFLLTHVLIYSSYGFVNARVVSISSLVSGKIVRINVVDNQQVRAGQPLLEIDPRPFIYQLQFAQARLRAAEQNFQRQRNIIEMIKWQIAQLNIQLQMAHDHLKRIRKVRQMGGIAQQRVYDQRLTILGLADQQQALLAKLKAEENLWNHDVVKQAEAEVQQAAYNLQNTQITAPMTGHITNLELYPGDDVISGKTLFALIGKQHWWIESRYRETQLRHIAIGDKVWIHIDMYPWHFFHGVVRSIGWGINRVQSSSSAAPSALVYLDPTTNWIQLAQRYPVRIEILDINRHYPLRVGATARTWVFHG